MSRRGRPTRRAAGLDATELAAIGREPNGRRSRRGRGRVKPAEYGPTPEAIARRMGLYGPVPWNETVAGADNESDAVRAALSSRAPMLGVQVVKTKRSQGASRVHQPIKDARDDE